MDGQSYVTKVLNLYSFVKTEKERTNSEYINQRLAEHQLTCKLRSAVSFCKTSVGIRTNNLSKLSNEEKEAVESCLTENFLKDDPNYFGERDTIFLDLNEYQ